MTTKQEAVFMLIYFVVMAVLTYPCVRWIWMEICRISQTTPKEAKAKMEKLGTDLGGEPLLFKA